uniref:uncharacterized protein LOC105351095 n=1 Tax=Fragaria vesca subsp. vesca TaxID=101020 RepID=UPI0005C94439|nr:PREDICTED: uncharacterized protein LOC105351095 [Fragaria vesca subsp. vesca]
MGSHECDQNGVLRSYSGSPPSHYSLKVDSFSFMTENTVNGYGAGEFEAGGHKWRLAIYPNGNKKRNVEGHISLYLEMAGGYSLQGDWEIYVDFRLFLLDQKRGKYLNLEVDDTCVFGAEVFVCKERTKGKRDRLLRMNNAIMYKHVWKRLRTFQSRMINATSQNYSLLETRNGDKVLSEGSHQGMGTDISLYLALSDLKPTPPVTKIFAEFCLRIVDQKHANHQSGSGKQCFSAKSSSWGFPKFITLSAFSEANKGLMIKNTCILEAEVTVHGIARVLQP